MSKKKTVNDVISMSIKKANELWDQYDEITSNGFEKWLHKNQPFFAECLDDDERKEKEKEYFEERNYIYEKYCFYMDLVDALESGAFFDDHKKDKELIC